MTEEYCSNL